MLPVCLALRDVGDAIDVTNRELFLKAHRITLGA